MSYVLDAAMFFMPGEMNRYEARGLERLTIEIAREGRVDFSHPAWVEWKKKSDVNQHVPLLEWSTIFYQRISLAVIEYRKDYPDD